MTHELNRRSRHDILTGLIKRVSDFKEGYRHNVAILGEELSGKTTLLKSLLKEINDEKIIPVYVEIPAFEFVLFVKRCLNSLLYQYLKRSQLLSARETLEMLVKRAKEPLPQTTALIEHLLSHIEREKPEVLFRDLFGTIESFAAEAGMRCIIFFDEFHHLKGFGPKSIWQELGKKIMLQKDTLFIFASSSKNEAREILANELSLLFGNFETLELEMLKSEECSVLISERLDGIAIHKDLASFLIHFTGGHPFYLKTICDEAAMECRRRQEAALEKESLSRTLERLLFDDWGIFNMKFLHELSQLSTSRNKNEFIYLLSAISSGKNRLKDLAAFVRRNREELHQKLKKLAELGIVSKNGSFYQINDRLMSFWLKFVLTEKLGALSPDHTEQAAHFRNRIAEELDAFITISHKDIADRMLDLFNHFEGEDINIDRKRLQLSPFKEVRIVHFENADLKVGIFAKSQECLWLAAIKEEGILEHDVTEFIQTAKKFKHKTINKVIICLGDIERNARLLAKESHIATWDLASINSLLDLYGKPRIIK